MSANHGSIQHTADFHYVRWIGEHNRFPKMNAEEIDVTPRLQWWKEQFDQMPGRSSGSLGIFQQ